MGCHPACPFVFCEELLLNDSRVLICKSLDGSLIIQKGCQISYFNDLVSSMHRLSQWETKSLHSMAIYTQIQCNFHIWQFDINSIIELGTTFQRNIFELIKFVLHSLRINLQFYIYLHMFVCTHLSTLDSEYYLRAKRNHCCQKTGACWRHHSNTPICLFDLLGILTLETHLSLFFRGEGWRVKT